MVPKEKIERAISLVFITMKAHEFETRFASLVSRWRMNCELVLDHHALDELGKKHFKEIAKFILSLGVRRTIHAPFQELFLGAPDIKVRQAAMERLEYAFDIASLYKPESIVLHLNYEDKRFGFVHAEWLRNIVPNLEKLAQKAQKMKAMLTLENVYEENPEAMAQVLSRLSGKNVFMCMDVGHVSAFSKASLREWLAKTNGFIRQFHLHDNDGKKDAHAPIGSGKINFSLVSRCIASMRHLPLITLEPHTEADVWDTLEGFCEKGLLESIEKKGALVR